MTRLPQVSGERAGSHAILDDGQVTLSIPCHGGRELEKGLLAALLRDAGLTVEEFAKLL